MIGGGTHHYANKDQCKAMVYVTKYVFFTTRDFLLFLLVLLFTEELIVDFHNICAFNCW